MWSKSWVKSKSRRKQRLYRYRAPLHVRRKFLRAMVSKSLSEKFGVKTLTVKKGDGVKVMRGNFRGISGEVVEVDYKNLKVYIDSVKRKKVSGAEYLVPIDPSKVMITKLNLEDEKRSKKLLEEKKEPEKKAEENEKINKES
jgi:large subunit ribosomal protein L24